jgi:hypothetical protein
MAVRTGRRAVPVVRTKAHRTGWAVVDVRRGGAWFGRWADHLIRAHACGDLADDDRGDVSTAIDGSLVRFAETQAPCCFLHEQGRARAPRVSFDTME